MARVWPEEKIKLRIGLQYDLSDDEALALKGDTIEELEKAAFQLRAELKDDLELALQRKVNLKTSESTNLPLPPIRSGSVSPVWGKTDSLAEMLARKVTGTGLMRGTRPPPHTQGITPPYTCGKKSRWASTQGS